jgi:hypothetical protein
LYYDETSAGLLIFLKRKRFKKFPLAALGSISVRGVSLPRCVPQLARREVKEYISAFLYISLWPRSRLEAGIG